MNEQRNDLFTNKITVTKQNYAYNIPIQKITIEKITIPKPTTTVDNHQSKILLL